MIMLVMMSFNVVLFCQTIFFLGIVELWIRLKERRRRIREGRPMSDIGLLQQVDEMDAC